MQEALTRRRVVLWAYILAFLLTAALLSMVAGLPFDRLLLVSFIFALFFAVLISIELTYRVFLSEDGIAVKSVFGARQTPWAGFSFYVLRDNSSLILQGPKRRRLLIRLAMFKEPRRILEYVERHLGQGKAEDDEAGRPFLGLILLLIGSTTGSLITLVLVRTVSSAYAAAFWIAALGLGAIAAAWLDWPEMLNIENGRMREALRDGILMGILGALGLAEGQAVYYLPHPQGLILLGACLTGSLTGFSVMRMFLVVGIRHRLRDAD